MTVARRGRPRDSRLDAAILECAIDELANAGFASFSVEDVAERAGVSKATVYRRFATRDDLVVEVLRAVAADVAEPQADLTARDRLIVLLEDIRRRTPNSRTFRIMRHASALMGTDSTMAELVSTLLIEPRRNRLRACIREGIDAGEFRRGIEVDAVATLLVGAVVHLGVWSGSEAVDRIGVTDLVDLAITGVGNHAALVGSGS